MRDVIVHLKGSTDDICLLDLTEEEVTGVISRLNRIRRASRWPRSAHDLTITARSGSSVTIYGDTIDYISTRPARSVT